MIYSIGLHIVLYAVYHLYVLICFRVFKVMIFRQTGLTLEVFNFETIFIH